MKTRYGVLFLTILILANAACAIRLLNLPVLPGTDSEQNKPRVEVWYSETIPSNEVVTLTWKFYAQL